MRRFSSTVASVQGTMLKTEQKQAQSSFERLSPRHGMHESHWSAIYIPGGHEPALPQRAPVACCLVASCRSFRAGTCCKPERREQLAAACASQRLPKLSALRSGMQRAFMSPYPELYALSALTPHGGQAEGDTINVHRDLLKHTLKVTPATDLHFRGVSYVHHGL